MIWIEGEEEEEEEEEPPGHHNPKTQGCHKNGIFHYY